MARYDVHPLWLRTPRGTACLVHIREGTNDHNTAFASLVEDEYHTAGLDFTGLFLDIGGFLGTVSLGILMDHPGTEALIVEPLPENIELIKRNLAANGVVHRATIVPGVVGVGETTIRYAFSYDENSLHHAFVGNANNVRVETREHREVTYRASSVADLVPDGAPLTKIDCEGGEWGFLADPAIATLDRVIGEWHPRGPDASGEWRDYRRSDFEALFAGTHDVEFLTSQADPEAGPGEFVAVRRA